MKSTQYHKLLIIVYSPFLALMLFLIFENVHQEPILSIILSIISILTLILELSFYKLTISINNDYFVFSFGLGWINKKYRLTEIKNCRPVKGKFSVYSRMTFEKLPEGGKSYVLSSALPSIEITYKNEHGIILSDRVGTNNPDEIVNYINKKKSMLEVL